MRSASTNSSNSQRQFRSRWRGLWRRAQSALGWRSAGGTQQAATRLLYVCDAGTVPAGDLPSGVMFRELPPNECLDAPEIWNGPAAPPGSGAAQDHGCLVGLLGGRVVYRAWFIRADGEQLRDRASGWSPAGPILFLHGGTTEPRFRGRGIHTAATRWLLRHARDLNAAHVVCVVHADNVAARRTVERAGFRVIGPVQ